MSIHSEREQFLDFLRRRRLRVTQERRRLFEEVFSRHGHLDAEQLLEALEQRGEKISRATVYRTLDLLVEAGLVQKHRLGRRRYLFEHVHPGQQHDHLVCTACGRVAEFISPGITALQREICKAHDFLPESSHLEISGLCQACHEVQDNEAAGAGG